MPAIEVRGLSKNYEGLVAVDDVSFSVETGQVLAILGPNGAGKTTTVEILEGVRQRDAGEVRVLDHDPGTDRGRLARRIGVMLQDADLWAGIRTDEAVRLFASFHRDADDPTRLIERLGLGQVSKTTYRRLSGGERRRLLLALALVGRPEIAFLDEPTAGMDIEGRVQTWELVSELRARGTTVVLTTHLLDEAESVADRVGIISRGRLVALGSPAELMRRGGAELSFALDASIETGRLAAAVGRSVTSTGPATYRVEGGAPTPELIARLAAFCAGHNVLIRRLDIGAASLADIYLELTRVD